MQMLASPLNEPQINKNETSGWSPFAGIDVRTSAPSIMDMILCLCGGLEIESTATLLRSSLQIQQMLSACRYELPSQHNQPDLSALPGGSNDTQCSPPVESGAVHCLEDTENVYSGSTG
jgi:hypothetical protein